MRILRLARRVLGDRDLPRDVRIDQLESALWRVTELLDADHPACKAALAGLDGRQEVR